MYVRPAQILELLEHTPIFSAGYKCILHIHSVVEECECTEMRYELDPKTKSKKKVLRGITFCALARPAWVANISSGWQAGQMLQSCTLYMSAGVQAFSSLLMRPAAPAPQVKFVKSNKAAVVRLAVEEAHLRGAILLRAAIGEHPMHIACVQGFYEARRCSHMLHCLRTLSLVNPIHP